jgi:hypothetical protein
MQRSWLPWAFGVVGVVLALGVAMATHYARSPAAEARARTAQNVPSAVAARASAPAAPAVRLVRVHIASEPPTAQLWLDGETIPNPFNHERAASTDVHVLEARLDGFRPVRNSLRFADNTDLHIQLQAIEPEPVSRPPKRPVAPVAEGHVPSSAQSVSEPPRVAPSPASAVEPSPAAVPADDVLGKRQLKRIGI